jgi:hypothetical protein
MDTNTSTAVSMWRCGCGVTLKAITELDKTNLNQVAVACPCCGHERLIVGSRAVSVSEVQNDVLGMAVVG